ncbi:hypothetical protein TrRE_jg4936 [Triparma retinervis]|uniref:Cullin family profile domain-containing protein n=1 Tax=Triparma retinervis TaxID=2557542 RepID=A0A9W7FCY6_9STRA|nr:hypothetical protein TrRE_jg4936 [Triparma retinervis]
MDAAQAKEIWSGLARAIDEIHNQDASKLSFEELYRNAYNLVLHKHGEVLYSGVKASVQKHLSAVGARVAQKPDSELLAEVSKCWCDHQLKMVMVRDSICMYMDRTYVAQKKEKPVYDLGLQIFRETIWEKEEVRGRLQHILLDNVLKERNGQLIDRSLMKNVLAMLLEIGQDGSQVYERDFEKQFLQSTKDFYRSESLDYLSRNSCPDYINKAERRLNEEHSRIINYLSSTTESKLMQIVETELIQQHAKTLVEMENSGCISMLVDDKTEDLRNMYDLFCRVPSTVDVLRDAVSSHVKKTGKGLVADQERVKEPLVFVKGVLAMRDKYDKIIEVSFRAEKKAAKKLKEAFETFINADSRSANYLAVYVDELMRSGLKGVSEVDADERLDKVIVIFRYLQDKDVFENFYKTHLSKRLLAQKSISDECEKSMVAKLKAECGYQYTSKLEGMFNDMSISRECMDGYKRDGRGGSSSAGGGSKVEINVDVLTMGYWPSQGAPMCQLPNEVLSVMRGFENFYLTKHTGRKLAWQTSLGTSEVKAVFGDKKHELIVTTYQMCILMLFNTQKTRTLADIKLATGIPESELKRHLISLCTPKHRILKKASKGKSISADDSFVFNSEFSSKYKRIKVPLWRR